MILMKKPHIKKTVWEKIEFFLLQFLRIIIVVPFVWKFLAGDWFNTINLGATLFLTFIPERIEKRWKIKFSSGVRMFFWLFIILANVLGDAFNFYWREVFGIYPWDTTLHFLSGFFFTLIGFVVFYWLNNRQENIKNSKTFVIFFAFCFSLSCAAVWEFFEFGIDKIFHITMGGDIFDTMYDMLAATLGTLITLVWANRKLKKKPDWYFNFFFKPKKNVTIELS